MQAPTDLHSFRMKVNMMLDNALNEDDQQEVMKFIQTDPECNKLFKTEKSFRTFVKENVRRPEITTDFIETIKASIYTH